jgi:hypothetical protein
MLLTLRQHPQEDLLVEVLDPGALMDPFAPSVLARIQHGEEQQDPHHFAKADLRFPSGEPLPRCWIEPPASFSA